jgi:hypothetical protein
MAASRQVSAKIAGSVTKGFDARRGMGPMRPDPQAPPTHGTGLVTCEGTRSVVDASILHSTSLPLHEATPTAVAHPAWGVHCRKRDDAWYIRWRPVHQPAGLD